MALSLSSRDVNDVKKALATLEKDQRYQPLVRWFTLLVALAFVAVSLYSTSKSQHFGEAFDNLLQESLQEHKAVVLIDQLLQVKVDLLRAEFTYSRTALDFAVGGGVLLGVAFIQFARRPKDRSQILLLRALLEQHGGTPNKSSNTNAGDTGAG